MNNVWGIICVKMRNKIVSNKNYNTVVYDDYIWSVNKMGISGDYIQGHSPLWDSLTMIKGMEKHLGYKFGIKI